MKSFHIYPLKIQTKTGINNDFSALFIINDRENQDYFEWETMEFSICDKLSREKIQKNMIFKDYKEYFLEWKKINQIEDKLLLPDEIQIKKNISYDLMRINVPFLHPGFYCSDRLVDIVNSNHLTGFKFDKLPEKSQIFSGKL